FPRHPETAECWFGFRRQEAYETEAAAIPPRTSFGPVRRIVLQRCVCSPHILEFDRAGRRRCAPLRVRSARSEPDLSGHDGQLDLCVDRWRLVVVAPGRTAEPREHGGRQPGRGSTGSTYGVRRCLC